MTRKIHRAAAAMLSLALILAFLPVGMPAAQAENDPSTNNVLQIVTGAAQWEGMVINCGGSNSMSLDASKTYVFTFRAYTPSKGVGLRFQTNTSGGWDWDFIADVPAEELQPPGWYEVSGKLNLDKIGVTGMPSLVLVKSQGDNEGEIAKFWIDDFIVTESGSGEVVFSEDFESGTTGAFRDNGGVCSIVPETAIYEADNSVISGEYALDVPSLKEIYKNYFLIGNIVNPDILGNGDASQARYEILKHHYNALTYENDMKPEGMWGPGSAYDKPEQRDFTTLDEQIKKMQDDGFKVIGHTLAWHGQSPNWLNLSAGNRADGTAVYKPYADARQNLEEFINLIAGRFYNHPDGIGIYSWDVLNEALRRDSAYPTDEENWGRHALGHIWPSAWTSPWYICYGTDAPDGVNPWDYVYDMYTLARLADPTAILYYNDYGMEDPTQVQLVVNMVNVLNAQWAMDTVNNPDADTYTGTNSEIVRAYKKAGGRLLIEGIGMQEHDTINTNIKNVEAAIHAYAVAGCKVSITELDVGVPGYSRGERLSEEDEWKQARYYAELFAMLKKNYEYIDRVTFWGLDDRRNWRPDELCHLFDENLMTKAAYYAVADPEGWLAANPSPPAEPKPEGKIAGASKGTVTIPQGSDWEIGSEWNDAVVFSTDSRVEGNDADAATAKVRVLWDDKYLYVLAEVTDSALRKGTENTWEQDSIEVFLSETNQNTGAYAPGDGQYRVNYENLQSFGSQGEVAGFLSAARIVPDRGYDIMMAIPFTVITPEDGMTVGFDIQVNDRNEEDARRSNVMTWNDQTGNSWAANTYWGNLTFAAPVATDPGDATVPPDNESPEPSPVASPSDNETTDDGPNYILIVILSILALSAVVLVVFFVLRRRSGNEKS